MHDYLFFLVIALLIVNLVLIIIILRQSPQNKLLQLEANLNNFNDNIKRTEDKISNEISRNREEINNQIFNLISANENKLTGLNSTIEQRLSYFQEQINKEARENRNELKNSLLQFEKAFSDEIKKFNDFQKERLDGISSNILNLVEKTEINLKNNNKTLEDKLASLQGQIKEDALKNRAELSGSLVNSLKSFENTLNQENIKLNEFLGKNFENFVENQRELTLKTETGLENMRKTIEFKLENIQKDSSEKLEQMRKTVDEKLHDTLEKRLSESFKIVSDRLGMVHKGLGEMQGLASGVNDLKRVLGNVKAGGILGQRMLEALLKEILTHEQYEMNIATKKGSAERVEFAIKLPGRDDADHGVYLPIDAKFPKESYEKIIIAFEDGDSEGIKKGRAELISKIKDYAKDISLKYIDPPNTTEFGIMFLPIEGLYAEVVQYPGLIQELQNRFKIIITGPTTLAAMLNSLQVGFKTITIEKRSKDIWNLLQAVKTEFDKFGNVLEKAQKKIQEADREIDALVGTRTRLIKSKLKNVEALPQTEARNMLDSEDNSDETV